MSEQDDGGYAFPFNGLDDPLRPRSPAYRGVTVRDYFAAQAMMTWSTRINATLAQAAEDAYAMADAMLAERERGRT